MTEETGKRDVEIDIVIEDQTIGELTVWRGCKDTGKRDGYVDFWVHRRGVEVVAGKQISVVGDLLLKGRLDATGCAQITFEPVHWCQLIEWQRHMQVLGHLYIRAFELMGTEPQADDGHGRSEFAKAMAGQAMQRAQAGGVRTIGLVES